MKFRLSIAIIVLAALAVAAPAGLHAQLAWRHFLDLREARNYFGAIPIGEGKVLVAGGYKQGGFGPGGVEMGQTRPTASCEIIDVVNGEIIPAGSMQVPHTEAVFLLTPDSNVVAISGVTSEGWRLTAACELYDRTTKSWRTIGQLQVARRQHTACFINDDELLVVGGRQEDLASLASAEIFNIHTGRSRLVADYPHRVNTPVSAMAPDGRVLVLSGREGGANSFRSPNIYQYDDIRNEWNQVAVLESAINAPQLMKLWNGDLIMTGGAIWDAPFNLSKAVLRYNTSGFAAIAQMQAGRIWHSQAQIDDHRLIITGGWLINRNATRECELIDLATGARTTGPRMIESRRFFQTVSVPVTVGTHTSVRVLAISGQNETANTIPSVEILVEDSVGTLGAEDESSAQGMEIFPNPTTDRLFVRFDLSSAARVRLELTDMRGESVLHLDDGVRFGAYSRELSLRDLPAGIYLLRMQAGERSRMMKIVRE